MLSASVHYFQRNRLQILYLFCGIFFLLLLAERMLIVFSYQGNLAGIDNNFVYPVMRLLKSLDIYPDPENYPFAVNPYSPIFFYISYAACKITGVAASDAIHIFFVTRGLCLLFDLTTIAVLYKIIRKRLQVTIPVTLLSILCFFFLISYWQYTMNRSDSLLLLWFSLILLYVIKYINTPAIPSLLTTALLCSIAIFTKQNAIIFPVATGAVLIYYKKWKPLIIYTVLQFGLFLLFFWFFSHLYNKGEMVAHLVHAINNHLDFRWWYIEIFKRISQSYNIVFLAAGIFMACYYLLKRTKDTIAIVSVMAIILTGWAISIAFKWGSHVGYLHESIFCLTAIIAFSMERFPEIIRNKLIYPVLFVLSFIFANSLLQLYFYNLNGRNKDKQAYLEQKEVAEIVLKELPAGKYAFASTDLYHDFYKILLQDRAILPNIDAVDCCTMPDGNFDYYRLREALKNGQVTFIIYNKDYITPYYQDIKLDKYKPWKTMGKYIIFRFAE